MDIQRQLLNEYDFYIKTAAQMMVNQSLSIGDEKDRAAFVALHEGRAEGIAKALLILGYDKALRWVRGDIDFQLTRLYNEEINQKVNPAW